MRKVPLIYVTETDMIDTEMVEKVGQGFVNSPARANGSRNLGPIPTAIVFTIHVSRQEHRIHSVHFKCSIASQNCTHIGKEGMRSRHFKIRNRRGLLCVIN